MKKKKHPRNYCDTLGRKQKNQEKFKDFKRR